MSDATARFARLSEERAKEATRRLGRGRVTNPALDMRLKHNRQRGDNAMAKIAPTRFTVVYVPIEEGAEVQLGDSGLSGISGVHGPAEAPAPTQGGGGSGVSAELRRLLAEATPGPWSKTTFGNASTARAAGVMASYAYATSRSAGAPMTDLTVINGPVIGRAVGFTGNGPHSPENAALIVAAVNALPALLDERDALLAVREAARAYLARRERELADWKAVAECGHENNDCPEMRHILDTHHVDDDEKDDAALRATLDRLPEDRP